MDIEELTKRVKKASVGRSLRALAAQCNVSGKLPTIARRWRYGH
ncbi:hypothetical protein PSV3_00161 [Septimatrevirus PSV32]|uniref:Uncharacterized protein n=4 Tax=Pseudomonas phage PSV3 TaxID=3003632 RepID=A0AAE9VWJ4_9CAUD|nr:hypothetical protein PM406_gp60 [Pseudomonas phage PSV3]YP_010598078.1 hypothetical protein PM407_gp57 [Pseudomonas phage PSV3]YP_010598102.1 hypothetical protein PM408_gp18 [Pseudomonas phage PSV3]YP_010598228.1 hypothetical protein PM409_gp58 [Pseudomonas phage PSV3]WBF76720.1 hypothetical protein PSV3_00018 [Pseudomonas phage PSV3]WBF76863.1 hypothetical protein PSV3_00161 [Pseudomonas phage PSV3]WBF76961.1 hypothetical protein PSV3_00259 [Pseudomonas phage PSV3]WBF77037.1 hypothetical